jgi:hypothetical protein
LWGQDGERLTESRGGTKKQFAHLVQRLMCLYTRSSGSSALCKYDRTFFDKFQIVQSYLSTPVWAQPLGNRPANAMPFATNLRTRRVRIKPATHVVILAPETYTRFIKSQVLHMATVDAAMDSAVLAIHVAGLKTLIFSYDFWLRWLIR